MADPNRKINLDLPSTDDDSDEPELNPLEVSLVKEFEEEFANRFSEEDQVFTEFSNQKPKPPPIVYPFDGFNHHNNRGGHRGGRFQNHGGHRHNFDNRRNFDRSGGQQNQQRYHRDRDAQQPHHHYNKRPRTNSDQPEGY